MKIAVVGQARAGKDTVADYLVGKYGLKEYKFSKGIHEVINLVLGEGYKGNKQRRWLQETGQSLRAILHEDIWVDYTFRQIEEGKGSLISDCRQSNEAKRLRQEGYTLIRVEADEAIRLKRMREKRDNFSIEDLAHETEVINFESDYYITNNGTMEELYQKVDEVVEQIKGEKDETKHRRVYTHAL